MDFRGKIAVITGGNSGIGLATAQELRSHGAQVAILGRDPDSLAQAQQTLGEGTLAVQGDVASLADLDRFYAAVSERFGRVDVLFVNAGVAKMGPIGDFGEMDFDAVMNINFKGAYFSIQKALPLFVNGGTIVLNTSINATIGMPTTSVYAASKAALSSLVRTLSAELLSRGIRVNAVSPGPTSTPLYGRLGLPGADLQGFAEGVQQQIPLGRFGTSEEIAKAVTFLASSDSSFIVGTELVADGGMSQL